MYEEPIVYLLSGIDTNVNYKIETSTLPKWKKNGKDFGRGLKAFRCQIL